MTMVGARTMAANRSSLVLVLPLLLAKLLTTTTQASRGSTQSPPEVSRPLRAPHVATPRAGVGLTLSIFKNTASVGPPASTSVVPNLAASFPPQRAPFSAEIVGTLILLRYAVAVSPS